MYYVLSLLLSYLIYTFCVALAILRFFVFQILVGRTLLKRTQLDNLMNKMVILVGRYTWYLVASCQR